MSVNISPQEDKSIITATANIGQDCVLAEPVSKALSSAQPNNNQGNKENIQTVNQQELTIEQKRKENQKQNGFQFISKQQVSSFLICKLCNELMIMPMRLFPCGHTYCKRCLKYQRRCPIPPPQCGKFYMALQPDIVATNLIDDLQVRCLSPDCPWYGTLDQFKKKHSKQCHLKNGGLQEWLKGIRSQVSKFDKQKEQRKKMSQNLQYQPCQRQKQTEVNIIQDQDVEVISSSHHPPGLSAARNNNHSNLQNHSHNSRRPSSSSAVHVIDIEDPNLKKNKTMNSVVSQVSYRHQQFVNGNRQRVLNQYPNANIHNNQKPQEIVLDLDQDIEAQYFNHYEGLPESSKKMVNNYKKKIDKSAKQHLPVVELPRHKKGQQISNIQAGGIDPENMIVDKKFLKQTKKTQKQGGLYGNLFRQ